MLESVDEKLAEAQEKIDEAKKQIESGKSQLNDMSQSKAQELVDAGLQLSAGRGPVSYTHLRPKHARIPVRKGAVYERIHYAA